MTTISYNISGKLDAHVVEAMERLAVTCSSLGADFLLVGAAARDIHFRHVHGIAPGRATADVDVAVLVASWEIDERLISLLKRDNGMTRNKKRLHRLYSANGVMLDVIPFGGLQTSIGQLSWPPHFDIAMSTIGFREALAFAPIYRLRDAPPLDIRVASAAGIAALKLIAWAAAYPLRKRDAIDFRFIRFPLHSDELRRGYNRSTVFG